MSVVEIILWILFLILIVFMLWGLWFPPPPNNGVHESRGHGWRGHWGKRP